MDFKTIAQYLADKGITTYFVGGCVRDEILGIKPDDIDICLVGADRNRVNNILEDMARGGVIDTVTTVHGSFPIWIIEFGGGRYEFALARTERSIGEEHQAFECDTEGVTIEQDLFRRDLTINSMAKNVLTDEIVDPYNGRLHLEKRVAVNVSEAFAEDPLRVIRAARFMARFDLDPMPSLVRLCLKLKPDTISRERIGMELKKLFEKPCKARKFFDFLNLVDWLEHVFPEVHAMIGVPQSPVHHPEGDVYTHTMHCIDVCKPTDWFTKTVMLCHDMGKVTHTTINGIDYREVQEPFIAFPGVSVELMQGKISSIGHENAGIQITKDFLKRIKYTSHKIINQISTLVGLHMIRTDVNEKGIRNALRTIMNNGLVYSQLVEVVRCDLSGRPPKPVLETVDIGQQRAAELLEQGLMEPVVTGELLLKCGMKPGSEVGEVVTRALELQDRGVLHKDNWLKLLRGSGMKQHLLNVNITDG